MNEITKDLKDLQVETEQVFEYKGHKIKVTTPDTPDTIKLLKFVTEGFQNLDPEKAPGENPIANFYIALMDNEEVISILEKYSGVKLSNKSAGLKMAILSIILSLVDVDFFMKGLIGVTEKVFSPTMEKTTKEIVKMTSEE